MDRITGGNMPQASKMDSKQVLDFASHLSLAREVMLVGQISDTLINTSCWRPFRNARCSSTAVADDVDDDAAEDSFVRQWSRINTWAVLQGISEWLSPRKQHL